MPSCSCRSALSLTSSGSPLYLALKMTSVESCLSLCVCVCACLFELKKLMSHLSHLMRGDNLC